MLLQRLVVFFVMFSVVIPGFSNQFPLREDYKDQREYIYATLLFFKKIEGKLIKGASEEKSSIDYSIQIKSVFSSINTSILQDLFENKVKLSRWMKISSWPLSAAVQADNTEMAQFLEPYLREYIRARLYFFKTRETSVLEDTSDRISASYLGEKKVVFAPVNTLILQNLFENEVGLSRWMKTSPGPFFAAVQADNVKLMQFFEQQQQSVITRKYNSAYAVQVAVVTPSINAVKFFFEHPNVNLDVVNVFGDNLVHLVPLGAGSAKSKLGVSRIFFQADYFPRLAHLLNGPNLDGEFPLDVVLREVGATVTETMVLEYLNAGAIPMQQAARLIRLKSNWEKSPQTGDKRKGPVITGNDHPVNYQSNVIKGEDQSDLMRGQNKHIRSACPSGFQK